MTFPDSFDYETLENNYRGVEEKSRERMGNIPSTLKKDK
jgi:hypothetical protein